LYNSRSFEDPSAAGFVDDTDGPGVVVGAELGAGAENGVEFSRRASGDADGLAGEEAPVGFSVEL
jgi:hypothetical protein